MIPEYVRESKKEKEYIDVVFSAVKENKDKIKGVIVDLRGNGGGAMQPMIAAISPFVPDGLLMKFRYKSSDENLGLDGGVLMQDKKKQIEFENIDKLNVPIAVLQNEETGSSGEITLLCFKGLPNVKTFGCGSAGYCSSNEVFKLFDGATLAVTTAKDVDRLGNEYCDDPIPADVETNEPLEEAKKWLNSKK